MGRLLADSKGVISGSISSRGDINIEKVGEVMGAPTYRFGMDTGDVESILIMIPPVKRNVVWVLFQDPLFVCQSQSFSATCIRMQIPNQKLLTLTPKTETGSFGREAEKLTGTL